MVGGCISYGNLLISISHPHDSYTWDRMAAIKSNIFKRWDTAAGGIRACCIKFVQRVVQVQTPGVIADPRVRDAWKMSLHDMNTNQKSSARIRMKSL